MGFYATVPVAYIRPGDEDEDFAVCLYLGDEQDKLLHWANLTPAAFMQLRESILQLECELCGGNHPHQMHGAAIVMLDTQRAPAWQELGDQIGAVEDLLDNQTEIDAGHHHKAYGLLHEYRALARHSEQHVVEWDFDYFDNKLSSILADAGYIVVNNSDGGAWMIYAAVKDDA